VNSSACPFYDLPQERVILETETTLAFLDAFRITEGHALGERKGPRIRVAGRRTRSLNVGTDHGLGLPPDSAFKGLTWLRAKELEPLRADWNPEMVKLLN
jgi:hypothetical protein